MPRHGEIVEPKERFVTYAHQMDISDEVMRQSDPRKIERRFLAEAHARAKHAAAEIDKYAPIIITMGGIRVLPKPTPFVDRWGVHVRVEFWRYVYDDAWRLAEEWQKEQIRRSRQYNTSP